MIRAARRFALRAGLTVYGGLAGTEDPNTFDLAGRNHVANATILTGDLADNDLPNFVNNDENCYHVVTAGGSDAASALDGFTITASNADGAGQDYQGGGLLNDGGQLAIGKCTFMRNWAGAGGGIANLDGGDSTIDHCTFEFNQAETSGGGVYNLDADPTLTECWFRYNTADKGAGLANDAARADVSHCVFEHNSAVHYGGGARNESSPAPSYTDCAFVCNVADADGGGLSDSNAGARVVDCTFATNRAAIFGGGLCLSNTDRSSNVVNCQFLGNFAQYGGALVTTTGPATVANCLMIGNVGKGQAGGLGGGGGVFVYGGQPLITNSTLCANISREGAGAGIYGFYGAPTVANCVLWGNTIGTADPNEPAQIFIYGDAPAVDFSCVHGWTGALGGTGDFSSDPMFVQMPSDGGDGWVDDPNTTGVDESANNDYGNLRLQSGSACVDSGDNNRVARDTLDFDDDDCPTDRIPIDLDHNYRLHDDPVTPDSGLPTGAPAVVDRGPYELGASATIPPSACPGDTNCDGLINNGDIDPFILAITEPALYAAAYPECDVFSADCNSDGLINNGDIDWFVGLLSE